jgi:hypothetical protein
MAKNQKTKKQSKIVDVECIISTTESGHGLLLSWEGDMYITNVQFLNDLIKGTLLTKKGDVAKGVNLGLLTNDGIDKTDLYLNMKGKSFYFSPTEGKLFVVPVSTVQSILEGTVDRTHMGEFTD